MFATLCSHGDLLWSGCGVARSRAVPGCRLGPHLAHRRPGVYPAPGMRSPEKSSSSSWFCSISRSHAHNRADGSGHQCTSGDLWVYCGCILGVLAKWLIPKRGCDVPSAWLTAWKSYPRTKKRSWLGALKGLCENRTAPRSLCHSWCRRYAAQLNSPLQPRACEPVTKLCRPYGTRIKFPTRPSTPPSAACCARLLRAYGTLILQLLFHCCELEPSS